MILSPPTHAHAQRLVRFNWTDAVTEELYTDLKSEAIYHRLASCNAHQATLHANYWVCRYWRRNICRNGPTTLDTRVMLPKCLTTQLKKDRLILTRVNTHVHTLNLKKRYKGMNACPTVRSKTRFLFYQSSRSVRLN